MNRARKTWLPALILGVACLIQWALLFIVRTPAWDATFYYAYARSIVFDGDLRLENDLRLSYPTTSADFAARQLDQDLTRTERVANPFASGSGLIWLPWLATMRVVAALGQMLNLLPAELSGYEWYFTTGVAVLSMFLGWLSYWLGYRISKAETGPLSSLAAALTLLFATPLLYYQYREPLYSHATSAFITAVVVFIWWRTYEQLPDKRQGLLLGALIGIASLVRWQHIVYLILPVVSSTWWWLGLSGRDKRSQRRRLFTYLVLVGAAAVFVLSIQFVQWRVRYGAWLTVPQGASFMDWRAPFLQPVLFSTFRGLLPWMPVFFLAALGLILLARRRPRLAIPLLLLLVLEMYISGSTRDWFAGAGFGPRRYTSELAIMIIGYAGLLQAIPGRVRAPAALVGGLLLGLHQWILLRYGLVEQIGGRNINMHPTFEWVDGSYASFAQQLVGHLPDILRTPWDFFVLPGSPLHQLGHQTWPVQHVVALLATAGFLFIGWRLLRRLRFSERITAETGYRVIGIGAIIALLALDLWILLWA